MASSSSSRPTSKIPGSDIRRLFTVIARPRNNNRQQFSVNDVLHELSDILGTYGIASTVTYVEPNYIIDPDNAQLQTTIVSWSPLHTTHIIFDLVPWSREHEDCQLPWIIGDIHDESSIIIDPLAILPTTLRRPQIPGNIKLRDNFASAINAQYDLTAPDFSYLMINEIKKYYASKHSNVVLCKGIATQMALMLQNFIPHLRPAVQKIETTIAMIEPIQQAQPSTALQTFMDHLRSAMVDTRAQITHIDDFMHLVHQISDTPIDLHWYRDIPSLSEVPVPPYYVTRLRTIHKTATQYVYGSEVIVTTQEVNDNAFEAYITVDSYRYKYSHAPMKTAATIETTAIYQSLKYMTNVLGFRIVDLNYPTLAQIMSAIHKHNSDIHFLQTCVNTIISISQTMSETFRQLQQRLQDMVSDLCKTTDVVTEMNNLVSSIQHFHATAIESFHGFMHFKEAYLTTYLQTQAPTATSAQWIQTEGCTQHPKPSVDSV